LEHMDQLQRLVAVDTRPLINTSGRREVLAESHRVKPRVRNSPFD
jgi:hypothetical protein